MYLAWEPSIGELFWCIEFLSHILVLAKPYFDVLRENFEIDTMSGKNKASDCALITNL